MFFLYVKSSRSTKLYYTLHLLVSSSSLTRTRFYSQSFQDIVDFEKSGLLQILVFTDLNRKFVQLFYKLYL